MLRSRRRTRSTDWRDRSGTNDEIRSSKRSLPPDCEKRCAVGFHPPELPITSHATRDVRRRPQRRKPPPHRSSMDRDDLRVDGIRAMPRCAQAVERALRRSTRARRRPSPRRAGRLRVERASDTRSRCWSTITIRARQHCVLVDVRADGRREHHARTIVVGERSAAARCEPVARTTRRARRWIRRCRGKCAGDVAR